MNKDFKEAKRFGIILSIILFTIGLIIPLIKKSSFHLWAIFLAIGVFVLSVFFTKIFVPIFKLWMKITHFIGKIISAFILGLFFYLIIAPAGLVMKCLGRDPLSKSWDKNIDSYWIKRDQKLSDPKRIEQQF
jgi:hypothetical protein